MIHNLRSYDNQRLGRNSKMQHLGKVFFITSVSDYHICLALSQTFPFYLSVLQSSINELC